MSRDLLRMTDELYDYLYSISDREAPILAELRDETAKDPRRNYQISPMQGQFMQVLVKAVGAKKILEVGVYTGYSSLAMALALPADGRLVALDISEDWTRIARRFWEKAGVAQKIELRLAPAAISLDALIAEGHAESFDIAFIDADKPNYPIYWDKALALLRKGGLAIADNTLFQGVVGPSYDERKLDKFWASRPPSVRQELIGYTHGARAFNAKVHKDARVDLAMVPVGDGMTFGVKR